MLQPETGRPKITGAISSILTISFWVCSRFPALSLAK